MTEEASSTPPPSLAEDGPPEKRSRAVGCATVAIALVAALCIFVFAWAFHVRRATGRFARRVDAMLSEYEAARPEVPEGENAAPLYTTAFALYNRTNEAGLIVGLRDPKKDYTTAQVGQYLKDNKAYLAALRKAAVRPKCDFELDLSQGFDLPVPHVSETEQAVRSLAVAARNAAQSGKPDEALEHLTLALRLARDVGGDSLLICRMVQNFCEGTALHGLEKLLNESEPGEKALERMLSTLTESEAAHGCLADILESEKILALVTVVQLMNNEASTGGITPMTGGGLEIPETLWKASGLLLKDARCYEQGMDRFIEAARKPYPDALDEAGKIETEMAAQDPKTWGRVNSVFLPAMGRIMVNDARRLALLRTARVALGCRIYRVRFGAYPKDLKELAAKLPEHFKAVPLDPFTGKSLLYARTGTGCKVWSVGDDRTDNGGGSGSPNAFLPDVVFELKQ